MGSGLRLILLGAIEWTSITNSCTNCRSDLFSDRDALDKENVYPEISVTIRIRQRAASDMASQAWQSRRQ
jgi:hypothetical protein